MKETIAETRKQNNFYARICNKRIEAARSFLNLRKEAEGYSHYVQGVKLKPGSLKALGRA